MASVKVNTGDAKIQVGTYTVYSDKVLGKGAYGVVHPATDSKGNQVAAKCIDGKDKHKIQKITKDLDKLMTLGHPNIVKVYDIHQVDSTIWMFMEFCEFGDLNSFSYKQKLSQGQKLKLMQQIAQGVKYLHTNNIIHRDIKPANILIGSVKPMLAKLTDFDLSKFLEPDYATSLMTTNVGTLGFKAPEFFQRNKQGVINYHRNVDIFALGLTFLALIQGNKNLVPQIETPKDDSELHAPIGQLIAERIKYGIKPLYITPNKDYSQLLKAMNSEDPRIQTAGKTIESDIREMIQRMTYILPEERISAREVVELLERIVPVSF